MEIETGVPLPKQETKLPRNVKEAFAAYKAAYRDVYGLTPIEPNYENGYIQIEGRAGVSLAIFKHRIKQLRNLKG